MIRKGIPRGGNIPPNIRKRNKRSKFGNIGLNINLAAGACGVKPRKQSNDFKLMGKYSEKSALEKLDIGFEEIKSWIVQELAHLFELKEANKKIDIKNKKNWLLNFLPDSMIQEIINMAKKLSKEEK